MSGKALQIAEERKEAKGKRERERYTQINAEFQRTARRGKKKPSEVNNAKKLRKRTEWERLEISLRKLDISRKHFI